MNLNSIDLENLKYFFQNNTREHKYCNAQDTINIFHCRGKLAESFRLERERENLARYDGFHKFFLSNVCKWCYRMKTENGVPSDSGERVRITFCTNGTSTAKN